MPKYSVDIVAKWDGEIVAEGEDEAVEQAIDLFQKEYIITDLNLDATNEEEEHVCDVGDKWCQEGANPYRHPDHDSHVGGCNCPLKQETA